MTAAKRNPTNYDLLKEIKEIKAMYADLDGRMNLQEAWKRDEDAYDKALSRVYTENKDKTADQVSKAWLKVLKEVYPILVVITAILYFYASTHGIKVTP
jgi:hypothetical protein